ncbi:hypothetical protein D3C80_1682180 [compost metagenome]
MFDLLVVKRATGRQGHAPSGPRQQPDLEVSLQACNVLADRRRTQTQGSGATGNAPGFDNLDEALDRAEQIHADQSEIRKVLFIKT